MSDLAISALDQGKDKPQLLSGQPGNSSPLRRRVTDVPEANVTWFTEHGEIDAGRAVELARAELTGQRDGYVIRWALLWVCQVLEPGDLMTVDILASAQDLVLDEMPDTDPRAIETEQQLLREAGLSGNGEPETPASVKRGDNYILRRYSGYQIFWEQCSVCQLYEPDGTTLIDQGDYWIPLDPATSPLARCIAAELLLYAGV